MAKADELAERALDQGGTVRYHSPLVLLVPLLIMAGAWYVWQGYETHEKEATKREIIRECANTLDTKACVHDLKGALP